MDILSILKAHAESKPNQIIYTFLDPQSPITLTFSELDRKAASIASVLLSEGLKQGDRVLIALPQGLNYLLTFWACLYAQLIAVPVYPPVKSNHARRTEVILQDSKAKLVVTDTNTITILNSYQQSSEASVLNEAKYIDIIELVNTEQDPLSFTPPADDAIAFLQYTSGSTGAPKGVIVKHHNLVTNLDMMQRAFEMDENTRLISWLPFFHDMGLIGNGLLAVYLGAQLYFMSPNKFIKDPLFWVKSISDYKGTHVFAPNFCFEMCIKEIARKEMEIDLSSLRFAINGAEPIRYKTILEFNAAFEKYGFNPQAWTSGYGMAEATLFISRGRNIEQDHFAEAIDETQFKMGKGIVSQMQENMVHYMVNHGQFRLNQELIIVNPETLNTCSVREIGEIWIKGPHISEGYWEKPEVNQQIFGAYTQDTKEGPWLRTGDLGYLNEAGDLFIVGRSKDLIIIRGKNYAPQDIEQTVEALSEIIHTNNVIAFSFDDKQEEKLVIVVGIRPKECNEDKLAKLRSLIKKAILNDFGLVVSDIAFIKPSGIAKTTSGKLQRQQCKKHYLADELPLITFSVQEAVV